ncbi:MAG TPA: aldehyde dehydrogenase family protein [Mycobacteriales bacterium]|nr:aldehyde dehydrogenase family protein [Mycobacteriales bacterium]
MSATAGIRIDGKPAQAQEAARLDSLNPATGGVAGSVDAGGAADAVHAVDSAAAALPAWAATSPAERSAALRAVADWLRSGPEDIARLTSVESGKRIAEARAELNLSANFFTYYADALLEEDSVSVVPGITHHVISRPLGVVGVVTPWNFPVSIPARKIAPALAAGCTVVFKPREIAPLSGLLFAEGLEKFLPAGTFNTVAGDGPAITGAWLDDVRVRGLSFTGSTRVGQILAAQAVPTLTRLTLELGGNAPFVLLEDADLDAAVETLMIAKYRNNGQSCIAANQVFVPAGVMDPFVEAFRAASDSLRLGDPLDEATDLGPMALPSDPDRLSGLAADAADSGAAVHTAKVDVPDAGFFAAPQICVAPGPQARVRTEEAFGPLTVVHPYSDAEEVLAWSRSCDVGLGGYVIGTDLDRAEAFAQQLEVGIVGINNGTPNTPQIPFAGLKLSGQGVEGAAGGMREFLTYQTLAIKG